MHAHRLVESNSLQRLIDNNLQKLTIDKREDVRIQNSFVKLLFHSSLTTSSHANFKGWEEAFMLEILPIAL